MNLIGMLSVDELFKGRHFDREIIVLCVRWYLRYKLSFRDLVEMMAERGLSLAHTTIMRWVQRFVPEFERRWNHFARQSGQSWRVEDLRQDPRRLDLFVSSGRPQRQDGGFQTEPPSRRSGCQIIFPEGAED